MANKLFNVRDRVVRVLRDNPEARNSDGLLISLIDSDINPAAAKLPYFDVMTNRSQYGLPTCESIRRARQKAQELYPELRSTRKVREMRDEQEDDYLEFARAK